jgi:nitrate/TMAO reductase-like tetraheme cytochrome c subunit
MSETRDRTHRNRLLFLMAAGAISIVLLVYGGYQLVEFSDSVAFCGRLCHTVMHPEYTAHQASSHSRVSCAQCHVGSGADYLVKSKLSGVPMIFATITGKYEKPIPVPVRNLRPARDTCEQCHRPQRFTGDLVRTHTTFNQDEANTKKIDTRVMRVGGGIGTAKEIHWHIAAKVYYLPMDEKRTSIGWVGVVADDGTTTEYFDEAKRSEITSEMIAKEKRLMDCMDCHNRATHVFKSPETLIDEAMDQGRIDATLPFVKREGSKALDPPNAGIDEANAKVDALREFYRNNYPSLYSSKKDAIDQAVRALREVASLTTFPEMKADWNSYADYAKHTGCFRCHGALTSSGGADAGKKIDNGCQLCHFFQIPQNQ